MFSIVYSGFAGIVIRKSHRRSSFLSSPKSSRPKRIATLPLSPFTFSANSLGVIEILAKFLSFLVSTPDVAATKSTLSSASSSVNTVLALVRISVACIARLIASSPIAHGRTSTSSCRPKFFIALAIAPTFPSLSGSTRTTLKCGTGAALVP